MTEASLLCPCNSNLSYGSCCQLLHNNKVTHSAEQLMRSRYAAFYMGNIEYLINTIHPSKRQIDDEAVLRQTIEQTSWLGLKIIEHKTTDVDATVEFVAFYEDKPIGQLHERSQFLKKDNYWFYVDGVILAAIKLGRNDICFCGSGKKMKKCHSV